MLQCFTRILILKLSVFGGNVAALLLQGSIQVYSRKVEYLYSLVLHALEFVTQKRFDFNYNLLALCSLAFILITVGRWSFFGGF